MRKLPFYIVDVFTEKKYSGNQLAVFTDATGLSADEMQVIARETNFAETTFIFPGVGQDDNTRVRIYTPDYEVPFAGHPTLGTAYIIKTILNPDKTGPIVLDLDIGKIYVTSFKQPDGSEVYWMRQIEPIFGSIVPVEQLIPVLGLSTEDFDPRFPIQEVSTGFPHIVVPLVNLKSLQKIRFSNEQYQQLIAHTWAKNIQIFCPETHGAHEGISTRMFTDCAGVPEDPATGSGNGCLAGYFIKHRYFAKDSISIRSEQGYEIGRPSLLYIEASDHNGSIEINVGGNVFLVAEGYFV